jgi:hypothetical protein
MGSLTGVRMLPFIEFMNRWHLFGAHTRFGTDRDGTTRLSPKTSRRQRVQKALLIEAMEDRVVLSAGSLIAHADIASVHAQVFRTAKAATQLVVNPVAGVNGSRVSLVATLTSSGSPLAGRTVRFQVLGRAVGKATTNAQGVATLANVKLNGVSAGYYARGITATFAGNARLKLTSGRGVLLVSRFATTLSDVAAGGFYSGNGSFTARLSSNGSPVAGQFVSFFLEGRLIGEVVTDSQGIASLDSVSLAGPNAGVQANAVTAAFAGGVTYAPSMASGNLTLTPLPAALSLSGLSDTYNSLAQSATVTISPANLPYTISYEDANGNTVANPTAAGSYTVNAMVNSANYSGSATGTLVIAPAQLAASGITASNKVYDGTTTATINASAATLSGVIGTDSVTLNDSAAAGAFSSDSVGTNVQVTVSGLTLSGPDASNYTVTAVSPSANITPASLTVSGVTANSKGYDGTTTATLNTTGATLLGLIGADQVTLVTTGATGTFATSAVGNDQTVTISGLTLSGTNAGNYTVVQPTTTANITQGTVTVTGVTASNKTYDGTTDATIDTSGAALAGVIVGESVTLDTSSATGSFDTKAAGTGKTVTISGLTLTGPNAGNYTLVEPTTTANIAAAALSVTGVTASDKVYDGTTSATVDATGATLTGVIAGDIVVLDTSGATGSFDTKDVGTGKTVTVSSLSLTGTDAGNYVITPPTTTANITAATLTVTGITASDKPYDGTTAATIDTTNAVLVGVITGDEVTLDTANAIGTFATPDVGNDQTVFITGLTLNGSDLGDYSLTQPTTTASIT